MSLSDVVPLKKAVFYRNNARGAMPIHSGGGFSEQVSWAMDYQGRQGRWEEKGGCEREATPDDGRLMRAREDDAMREHLDYVGREGRFVSKGAGGQADASYWGQYGPISRDELEAELESAEGAFVDSLITVERGYAAMLGMDTKEAFQNLMRNTWREAAMHWEMGEMGDGTIKYAHRVFDEPDEVRWFACYHTDAPESLHVHITTWSSKGSIREGEQVTRHSTMQARAEINREGYRLVREERDVEQSMTRELVVARAREEIGADVPEAMRAAIARGAASLGREAPDTARTSDAVGRDSIERKLERVRDSFEQGRGRISRDYGLQARARDVADELYARSPGYREAWDRYRELVEAKADVNALVVGEPEGGDGGLSKGQRIVLHERERFVRKEMDDLKSRVASAVIRSADPDGPARERIDQAARAVRSSAVYDSMKLHENPLGLSRDEAARLLSMARSPMDDAQRGDFAQRVVESPGMQRRIARAAEGLSQESAFEGKSRESIEQKLEEKVMASVAVEVRWRSETGHLDPDRYATFEASRIATRVQNETRPVVDLASERDGIALGMSLSEHRDFERAFERAVLASERGDEGAFREACRECAGRIVETPAFQRTVADACERVARETGGQARAFRQEALEYATAAVEKQVVRKAEHEVQMRGERDARRREADNGSYDGAADSLGRLAGGIAIALSRSAALPPVPRKKKRPEEEREAEQQQEMGR